MMDEVGGAPGMGGGGMPPMPAGDEMMF